MQAFKTIKSTVIPIDIKNIDTDMIIPAQFLTLTKRTGYGDYLFERLKKKDRNFPLNLKKYQSAKILVANSNFGCGSSREHAVWALRDYGIRVIIAPNFSDIFKSNAGKNALVLIELDENKIQNLLKEAKEKDFQIIVDLEKESIELPNRENYLFSYDPFLKDCILNGLDDLSYIQQFEKEIDQYDEKRSII